MTDWITHLEKTWRGMTDDTPFRVLYGDTPFETPVIVTKDGGQLTRMNHYGGMMPDARGFVSLANLREELLELIRASAVLERYLILEIRMDSHELTYLKQTLAELEAAVERETNLATSHSTPQPPP